MDYRTLLKKSFRQATTRSSVWNVAKTLGHTLVFWAVFLVVGPWLIVQLEGWLGWSRWTWPHQVLVSGILFGLFGCLGISSGVTMAVVGGGTPLPLDCATRLVIRGSYRFVRNPMAVAGIAQGVLVGTGLGSTLVVVYALAGAVIWDLFVRPVEEEDLQERFGAGFVHYTQHVRCWIPRLTPYRVPPEPPKGEEEAG